MKVMRKNLLLSLAMSLLFLSNAYGQDKGADDRCADPASQTLTVHKFRRVGETIEIAVRGDGVPASVAGCEPVSLELRWANGRNNGSNLKVTLWDGNNRPLYARGVSAFLTGVREFELSAFDAIPQYGSSLSMISVPTKITIEAERPFAAPVNLSYMVVRVTKPGAGGNNREQGNTGKGERGTGNEVASIHHAVRLIGASRLPLIQIELKTNRPFPVREVPLQLRIGNKVFTEELTGDHTGRKLTLSLTPEMFSELTDGDEIVAFFSRTDGQGFTEGDAWFFGKLVKAVGSEQ